MILNKFLWNAKKPKIKYVTVIGKWEDGGLKMPDFESKVKSIKMVWIQQLFDGSEQEWNNTPTIHVQDVERQIL